jgi:hypothetical protein
MVSQMASIHDVSQMASIHDVFQMASTHDVSQMASIHDDSQMASTHDVSQMASIHDVSQMASIHYDSQLPLSMTFSQPQHCFPNACYMFYPCQSLFYDFQNINWGVQMLKLFSMPFFSIPLPKLQYFLQHIYSSQNTFNHASLRVRDHVMDSTGRYK